MEKEEIKDKKAIELKRLKALAYDLMVNIQTLQNDLMRINLEISKLQR